MKAALPYNKLRGAAKAGLTQDSIYALEPAFDPSQYKLRGWVAIGMLGGGRLGTTKNG
jgi:hypothetical protein